jgi:hypothetical protein
VIFQVVAQFNAFGDLFGEGSDGLFLTRPSFLRVACCCCKRGCDSGGGGIIDWGDVNIMVTTDLHSTPGGNRLILRLSAPAQIVVIKTENVVFGNRAL